MGSIFISYSHEDSRLKNRVVTHLSVLPSRLKLWDDSYIKPGENWYGRIQRELRSANAAVLLVSADFLTSNFILKEEVPQLLERDGLYVTPIIARPCAWQEVTWLRRMQVEPEDGRPLSTYTVPQVEQILAMLAVKLAHRENISHEERFGRPLPPQRDGPEKPERAYRVLIVDDQPIARTGLTQLLRTEPDMTVVGTAEDGKEAVELSKMLSPDVVLMDIELHPEMDGIQATEIITQQSPSTKVLVFSMHDEAKYAERALQAGAMGYVTKHDALEKVATAIRCVSAGEVYLSKEAKAAMVRKTASKDIAKVAGPDGCLSDRELEVFHMIGEGCKTREMAEKLHLSVKTIETYRAHIKEKLGLQDANELLRSAIKWASAQGGEAQ